MPAMDQSSTANPEKTVDRAAIARMLRQLLIDARGNHVVWGRMLRGPTPVEELLDADLEGLIQTVQRHRVENNW